ncbi:T9SS type A sorting domain-containing protein [Candidatus Poribacteria bacterium]|nr:T9SS type A sorting domain-containing protein [Candidatus Poribacteria bacterium]MYB02345.1 T9SS type A sorting domain-containing protein [Candidatus Poribacteria bacterium]
MQFTHVFLTVVVLFHFVHFGFAQEVTTFDHGDSIQSVAFSPMNNSLIASAGGHNTIKLWDWQRDTVKTLSGHQQKVNSIVFSPDGRLLVSGSEDRTIKIWDVSQWENIESREPITIRMPYSIHTVVFHPDGQLLATSGRHAKLLDISNRTEIATLQHDNWVWTAAFSHDGNYFATDDGVGTTVKVWDVQREQIATILDGHTSDINFVKFSPDDQTLASSSWGGEVKLWHVSNWELLGTLRPNGVATVDFSADGKVLASGGWGEVTLWSVASGEKIATLQGHTGLIRGVAFSSDGTLLASGGEGGMVRVQNIKNHLESIHPPNIVRLIYFLPSDRTAQSDIDSKIEAWVEGAQTFFADTMEKYGYGRKTFTYETDESGKAVVHHIAGKFTDAYYDQQNKWIIWDEIREAGFDPTKNIYIAFMDFSEILDGLHCGTGGNWDHGGVVNLIASEECLDGDYGHWLAVHEIGHAFGLKHDYRNHPNPTVDLMVSSACTAELLNVHPYFNSETPFFNEPTTIEMWPPRAVDPEGIRLRFTITDPDGLHQARLVSATLVEDYFAGRDYAEEQDYLDQYILDCKSLSGSSPTVTFITTQLASDNDIVILQVIDVNGNFTEGRFPVNTTSLSQHLEDVNGDGIVNIQDLVLVAGNFGQTGQNVADVNEDGVVNIQDLVLVAGAFGRGAAAPSVWHRDLGITPTWAEVQQWLREARQVNLTDPTFQKGILVLEQLLVALTPKETALLPNYPNPFNPETWIPYQLAAPAEVAVSIYAIDGKLVRALELGYQPIGIYESRSRAAYWDGKNALGESVASGVYFYTLTAGDFTATRKMLIRK